MSALCPICLGGLSNKKELSCSHSFHTSCIDAWTRAQESPLKTCPVCRHVYEEPLPGYYEFETTARQRRRRRFSGLFTRERIIERINFGFESGSLEEYGSHFTNTDRDHLTFLAWWLVNLGEAEGNIEIFNSRLPTRLFLCYSCFTYVTSNFNHLIVHRHNCRRHL